MKKIIGILLALILIVGAVVAWMVVGPVTWFSGSKEALYIRSDAATKQAVMDSLRANKIIKHERIFSLLADRLNYWQLIKPGKYEIKKGSSLLSIVRMLRNGQQTPVNLVITKLRTKEDLARMTGSRFEFDSAQMMAFLNNSDSLRKYNIDPERSLALVLPDTYTYFWNTTPAKVYKKLAEESEKFWTKERKQQAQAYGLDPIQAYTLASIVEEETNASAEKGHIASVYLNRMNKGMPLQADPTVKFALKDFSLKRIYQKHLEVESPYNTYRNRGLPPGPICTPSRKTIDAVLNSPKTEYIYFVASPKFDGTHDFSVTYDEHLKKAREYQAALNQLEATRNNTAK
jgi:UPF0755 protein